MNNRKRKLEDDDLVYFNKKSKLSSEDCLGGAWQEELKLVVESKCNVRIDGHISSIIFEYAKGWWETCMKCEELFDPVFGEVSIGIYGKECVCKTCNNEMKYRWKISKYVFNDDDI